ncbi:hypothetical protein SAMN04487818_110246 [Actinokineospora terrae]|uniref:Uncharacterized protein n=1 Tax=Actinokineospora terrae TaxID=155974 RepID=A0A1H9WJD1_9PSEU|nr:hypothetical protein SAMN04487818_110246 [Actinokineospora terrae]
MVAGRAVGGQVGTAVVVCVRPARGRGRFITSRYAGQSDSDAFLDAALEQLAAYVGESVGTVLHARAGQLRRLLDAAAARAGSAGRRLVLVVDGLDEDTSGAAANPASPVCCPSGPWCTSWSPAACPPIFPPTSASVTPCAR